jgi:hypothetical protein
MEEWNTANYKRLRYQVDTKWSKGHLPKMFESYQKFIGKGTQREKFDSLTTDCPRLTFDVMWRELNKKLYKFGRYSTWFYMQHLKHTAKVKMEPTSLMLNDVSGSRSHRNGFLYAIDCEHMIEKKLNKEDYAALEVSAANIKYEAHRRFPHLERDLDYFTMETALCSFKKIFRAHHGRYLGYYLDRQADEIKAAEGDGWNGIDWNVLWQARHEVLDDRLTSKRGINKGKFGSFLETGQLDRLEWMFDDVKEVKIGLEEFMVA